MGSKEIWAALIASKMSQVDASWADTVVCEDESKGLDVGDDIIWLGDKSGGPDAAI